MVDFASWGWPQLVYLTLVGLAIGFYMAKHGQPKKDTYNIWYLFLSEAIMVTILYFGGFFS